jgi:hypothetical protein
MLNVCLNMGEQMIEKNSDIIPLCKHVCFIVKDGRIYAQTTNKYDSLDDSPHTCHAEACALKITYTKWREKGGFKSPGTFQNVCISI